MLFRAFSDRKTRTTRVDAASCRVPNAAGSRVYNRGRIRPRIEILEDRTVPSTFSVTNALDNGDNINPLSGSLRAAIIAANAFPNSLNPGGADDLIAFAIPGDGAHTIHPLAPLPIVTDPAILDATTEPGYAGTPLIELDGTFAFANYGLDITAGPTTVRGFAINRFVVPGHESAGIVLEQGIGNNIIQGNYLGTNLAGAAAFPVAQQMTGGIKIYPSNNNINNLIGTNADGINDAAEGNVISGNSSYGVEVADGTTGNLIAGNRIGTSADGTAALPNLTGVQIDNASNITIGGTAPGAGNLIAYNSLDGVSISGGTDNLLQNNNIFGNGRYDVNLGTAGTVASIAGSGSGNFFIASAAVLQFLDGYTFAAGSSISGTGTAQLLPGDFLIPGDMTLTGVTMQNLGDTYIGMGGTTSHINLVGGAILNNMLGGEISLPGDPCNVFISGNGLFQNDGLVNVAGANLQVGAGTSTGSFQTVAGDTLDFLGGYTLNGGTAFAGSGQVLIQPAPLLPGDPCRVAAPVTIPNLFVGSGGTLDVASSLTVTQPLQLFGSAQGTGTIIGNVINSGFVSPGYSPGTLTINGDYTQTAAGTLKMEIAGTAAGQYDQLIVTGAANLGGTLDVVLLNGFAPPPGTSFPILQYGNKTGSFAQTVGDYAFLQYGTTGLSIQPQAGTTGSASGGGQLDAMRTFGFGVQGRLQNGVLGFQGALDYFDHAGGVHLQSTLISYFRIGEDGRSATFRGTARVNGVAGYTFQVDIVDGAAGAGMFRIRIYQQNASLFYDSLLFGPLLDHGQIGVRR